MDFNIRRFLLRCSSLVSVLVLVIPQIASAADDDDPPGSPSLSFWVGMKLERGSMCSGDSERLCCNEVRRGKS
jgi:hypothetical protein